MALVLSLMLRKMNLAIVLWFFFTPSGWARTESRLLALSTSGSTALFSLGSLDGVREGDYGVILKQIRSLSSRDLRLVPVARARNIKLNNDSSVWILFHIFDPALLVKGDRFELLSESHLLSGRRLPSVGRTKVVTQKNKLKEQTNYSLNDDKDRLSKLKSNYQTIASTHEAGAESSHDFDQIDLAVWERSKNNYYPSSIYKSASKEEFRRQLRLATFEKLVTHYTQKINDPDFNYETFYEKQRRAEMSNEFKLTTDYDTEYNKFLRQKSIRSEVDAKLFRSILEKGEAWSEDYSDEELLRTLNQVSALQEKHRRETIQFRPTQFQVALDYAFPMLDLQTNTDPNYKRENRYSIEADFEFIPILKHPQLQRLTLNAGFRSQKNAFEVRALNADFEERSVSLGANWYPWYAPNVVNEAVIFLGTYLRSGFARVSLPQSGERGNYTVLSFPGLRAGVKYLVNSHFGVRLTVSFETQRIERYESSRSNSTLPSRSNLADAKVGVGLIYAF
jgi:hypothetical protein